MTKVFYDNNTFYESYVGMRRGTHSANDYIERPSLIKLLPNLKGKRVLDLGCGMGDYIVDLMADAQVVDAVDISDRMLDHLRAAIREKRLDNINVIKSAIEDFDFKTNYYDLVISMLALHYIDNLDPVFRNIWKSLKTGGSFIFNVEHPIYTAAKKQGWEIGNNGVYSHWRLDDYFDTGMRRTAWHGVEVERYHRTIENFFDLLVNNSGFQVAKILEPSPSDEVRRLDPELNRHHRRPPFLMFLAYKR